MKLKRVDFIHPISVGDLGQVTGIALEQQGRKFTVDFMPDTGLVTIKQEKVDEAVEVPITNVRKMVRVTEAPKK